MICNNGFVVDYGDVKKDGGRISACQGQAWPYTKNKNWLFSAI